MAGIDSNTVAMLHMDEDPFVDSSQYSRTVTPRNGAVRTATQFKFGGYGCSFPNATSDVAISAHSDLSMHNFTYYTWDFWFKTTATWINDYVIKQNDGTNNYIGIYYNDAGFWVRIRNVLDGGEYYVGYNSWFPTANVWHHVAVVKNANTMYLYGDGQFKAAAGIGASGLPNLNTTELEIGPGDAGGVYTTFFMDEFRASNVARWTSAPFDVPTSAYNDYDKKVSGTVNDSARIITIDESNWSVIGNEVVSTGSYEIATSSGSKLVVARREADGEIIAYGDVDSVTP